jgi:hypothetical protein
MKKRIAFVTAAIAASFALSGTALADPQLPSVGTEGCSVHLGEAGVGPGGVYWNGFYADTSSCLKKVTDSISTR